MSHPLKIMVIAGHPADMFDHCGGTLMHHIQQGDSVTCLTVTQGLRVHDEVVSDMFRHDISKFTQEEIDKILQERQKVKYKEAFDACALFGITDVRFLDYDDEVLSVTPEMITKLAKAIRDVHPDLVITHWPYQSDWFSNHHAITGQLALAALGAASGVNFKDQVEPAKVTQIAFMLCPSDLSPHCAVNMGMAAYANYIVDVSDVYEQKVRAIYTMKSQKYDIPGYAEKTTEQWNGNIGVRIRSPYAEAFVLNNPGIGTTIPISDYQWWLSHADERELLERMSAMPACHVLNNI